MHLKNNKIAINHSTIQGYIFHSRNESILALSETVALHYLPTKLYTITWNYKHIEEKAKRQLHSNADLVATDHLAIPCQTV